MDLRPPSEIAALKADSFGRISLMQGGDGPFVRRDLAHVPLWLRLPAWWLARREALALRKVAGMADVPQLLAWTGSRLDRSYMEGAAHEASVGAFHQQDAPEAVCFERGNGSR